MSYLMENRDEDLRLAIKTDPDVVKRQAAWAGIGPGMRVLDVGCGSGITTAALADLVGQNGHVVGLDTSEERLAIAQEKFSAPNISFVLHDIRKPYRSPILFDAIWARFILEYFRKEQRDVVANSITSLRIGGIACLIDTDNHSLGHHGENERVIATIEDIVKRLERDHNFDPYAGRKLYSHLHALGFTNIACMIEPHHLIYDQLNEKDAYNWVRKLELTARQSGCQFEAYSGEDFAHFATPYEAFAAEFKAYFADPSRFCYTPLMILRGTKALKSIERMKS
ncbi:MAG: methyltransferase domain-containing protein [Deltaproteobacteria bacterium]|jgi:ubiquinone/menaquinone biosynthesis C-methylase UbiE|nr:methyltransferase domain-containing protein [Deltaproteobacteria bacterium]